MMASVVNGIKGMYLIMGYIEPEPTVIASVWGIYLNGGCRLIWPPRQLLVAQLPSPALSVYVYMLYRVTLVNTLCLEAKQWKKLAQGTRWVAKRLLHVYMYIYTRI